MPGRVSKDITSKSSAHEISPVKYFISVIAALLIIETLVMVVIHRFLPPQPLMVEAFIDSFLLAFVLFPFLYVFVFSPLLHIITEQKLTEARLRASELELCESSQKLRILFQAAPVAIFVLDRAAHVTMWNGAAERIFGWTAEEIIGKHYPLMPPHAGEEFAASFQKLLAGETLPCQEVQRLRKDGSMVDVSLYLSPLFNAQDKVYATLGIAMDISSRKEAEVALVETKEKYRRLVDFSPYGIAIHDGERFLFSNDACAAMLGGETPDDIVGRPVMDFVYPDAREEGEKYIEEIISQGKIFPRLETKFIRMDGKVVDVEIAAIPFTLKNKRVVHLIATDISDRKLAEQQHRVSCWKRMFW